MNSVKDLIDDKPENEVVEEQKEEKKKKVLTPEQKKKAVFYTRLVSFLAFSIIGPIAYIMARFKPFQVSQSTSIGLAGIAIILILMVAIVFLVKFYLDGMKTKYSFIKQLLEGLVKVILPLCSLLALAYMFQHFANQVIEILLVLIPCEACAIIVNPLPKWAFDNNVDGLGEIIDKITSKKSEKSEK